MKKERSPDMEDLLLSIEDLYIEYETYKETVKAVNGINLQLNRGEILGLVGETGAGKTTTALGIMRLLAPGIGKIRSGKIMFAGMDLAQASDADMRNIRGKKISMIFQDPMTSLNPVLTVNEQIREVIKLHTDMNKEQLDKRVDEMLELVGISPQRKNEYPHQFSGGMKQRVMIAIALACDPELLIADEPTTALDVTIQAQVLDIMNGLKNRLNTAMLLITHDLGVVAQMCDHVAIMYAGEIIENGTVEDIFEAEHHHSYTKGLFGSIPNLAVETDRLSPVNGLMPNPADLPSGCKFHPRCPNCMDICKEKIPVSVENGTHLIKCHRYGNGHV